MAYACKNTHSGVNLRLTKEEHRDILVAINLRCVPKYKHDAAKAFVVRLRKLYDALWDPEPVKATIKKDAQGRFIKGGGK